MFQNNFDSFLKFGCFSLYRAFFSAKKQGTFLDAKFNSESVGTNLKFQKLKSKKLGCLFLFALFNFQNNSNKDFYFFSDNFEQSLDNHLFFAMTLKNYKLCYLKLN